MENKVVVAYASKYGATAEIAEKIGERLRQSGLQVDVVPVKKVKNLKEYKAVILGSAVYIGQWRKEAVKFLKRKQEQLAKQPVWLFSSGPTQQGDPIESNKGEKCPASLKSIIEIIKPRDITIFHGSIDTAKLNFIEKFMVGMVKAPVGDIRQWDNINAWAETIANALNN